MPLRKKVNNTRKIGKALTKKIILLLLLNVPAYVLNPTEKARFLNPLLVLLPYLYVSDDDNIQIINKTII